jgi:hypothetical protein
MWQYTSRNFLILRSGCIKDLPVNIFFHHHVDFLCLHAMELLGIIRTVIFSFSTTDTLLMLYFVLANLSLSMLLLHGNLLLLPTPINLGACKEILQPFAKEDSFKILSIIMTIFFRKLEFMNTAYQASSPRCFFFFRKCLQRR